MRDEKIKVKFKDAMIILLPYIWSKVKDQLISVLPIAFYLVFFQYVILKQPISNSLSITIGITVVIFGLMFFMEGLKLGLMPFGENIGSSLPQKSSLPLILGFALLVGFIATLAEPAIGTLKAAGKGIDPQKAPLLFDILTNKTNALVSFVGIGVGIATLLGILRFLKNWSLKVLILPVLLVLLVLTIVAHTNSHTSSIVGLAWDCGGVTTGPVTVPLVLSLGIGVSAVIGRAKTGMAGFGIVTLASLFPIIAVLCLGLSVYYSGGFDVEKIAYATEVIKNGGATEGPGATLFPAILLALQAIIPLVIFLYIFQKFILKEGIRNIDQVLVGIVFTVIGLILFNIGLSIGLYPLGGEVGSTVPSAYHPPDDSIYGNILGRVVAIIFAFFLGYGATLAEPALNALGMKVEDITEGSFKKTLLMQAVAIGVAVGIALGITKFIYKIPLIYMLIPPYLLLIILTILSSEKFVNIGWDSAGVTTGPITVPLVIAMGLGVGKTVGAVEGFGIISMASVCPIISVLSLGLLVNKKAK